MWAVGRARSDCHRSDCPRSDCPRSTPITQSVQVELTSTERTKEDHWYTKKHAL